MKKFLLGLVAMTGLFFVTSCSNEADLVVAGGDTTVSFNVGVNNKMLSRAIGDGQSANTLVYQVFDETGATPVTEQQNASVTQWPTTANVTLVAGKTYKIVFWAQNNTCTAYNTTNLAAVTVDYANTANNDETRDAFYKVQTVTVEGGDQQVSVTLERPFAQVNVGMTEEQLDGIDITKSKMTVKGVYSTINLLTGAVSDAKDEEVTFSMANVPAEDLTVKVSEEDQTYKYLSMSYILVPESSIAEMAFAFTNADATSNYTLDVDNVPVKRNYRTNILGNLFTGDVTFQVDLDPDFIADENTNGDLKKGEGEDDEEEDPEPAEEVKIVSVQDFKDAPVSTEQVYQLSGTVRNIKNTQYGNFDLEDQTGTVYVYGLSSPRQEKASRAADQTFSSLGIQEGDKITIKGYRADYQGTPQVGEAWLVKIDEHKITLSNVEAKVEDTKVTFSATYTNLSELPITKSGFKYEGEASADVTATATDGKLTATVESLTPGTYTVKAYINEIESTAVIFRITDPNSQDEPVTITIDFTKTNDYTCNQYYEEKDATYDGYNWTFKGLSNNSKAWNYVKCGGKASAGNDNAYIISKAPIEAALTTVTVNAKKLVGSATGTVKLYVATDSQFAETIGSYDAQTITNEGDYVFVISNAQKDCYYKLDFNTTNTTTTNGVLQINKVTFNN